MAGTIDVAGARQSSASRRRPRVSRAALLAVVIAVPLLLAGSWFVTRLQPRRHLPGAHHLPPLPEYGLELTDWWGAPFPRIETAKLRQVSLLSFAARPAEPTVGPVAIRVFVSRDGVTRPWAVHFDQSESGAFFLKARVEQLPGLAAGPSRLTVVIARPWAMPTGELVPRHAQPGREIRVLEASLEIAPD